MEKNGIYTPNYQQPKLCRYRHMHREIPEQCLKTSNGPQADPVPWVREWNFVFEMTLIMMMTARMISSDLDYEVRVFFVATFTELDFQVACWRETVCTRHASGAQTSDEVQSLPAGNIVLRAREG